MSHSVERIFKAPSESYFLFGPRGTGKTTWLKQHYQDGVMIDLLDAALFRSLSALPERLEDIVYAYGANKYFIIDEIQKIPALFSVHDIL